MAWRDWVDHPEKLRLRQILFQIHFWIGAMVGGYILLMSVSGALIVYRSRLYDRGISVERIVDFHANLLAGNTGRFVNGIGALCLIVLCVTGAAIWWPGIAHWRRSLVVDWRASFARLNWDVHSAFGVWFFVFVLMWALSGAYLVFPDQFASGFRLDPGGPALAWLTAAHFGRLARFTGLLWMILGLVPAVLAFTGVFICCRRVIFKRPTNPWIGSA